MAYDADHFRDTLARALKILFDQDLYKERHLVESGLSLGLPNPVVCYTGVVDRDTIIVRLREHEAALRARGVAHAALFGSRARGEERADSDTDILIEFDPVARVMVYDYVALKEYIAHLFDGPVDVIDRDGLKPFIHPPAEAVYAF